MEHLVAIRTQPHALMADPLPRVLMGSRRTTMSSVSADSPHVRLFSAMSLSALPAEALATPGEVAVLHASHNRLREVILPSVAPSLTRLEELHLGWNELASVPLVSLAALTTLALPHNHLTSIPPELSQLFPRLRVLDLSRNKLASLPSRTVPHFLLY